MARFQRQRDRGGVRLGHVREVDPRGAFPTSRAGLDEQRGHGVHRDRPFEVQGIALVPHIQAALSLASAAFLSVSILIRPSTPLARASSAKASR